MKKDRLSLCRILLLQRKPSSGPHVGHGLDIADLGHRFTTFFGADIPVIKIWWHPHPLVWESVTSQKHSDFATSSFLKLLIVIHTDNKTENTLSYCLPFIPYCPLETNLVTFLLLLIWNYLLTPWHAITQNHVQIVRWNQTVLIFFSTEVARKILVCNTLK